MSKHKTSTINEKVWWCPSWAEDNIEIEVECSVSPYQKQTRLDPEILSEWTLEHVYDVKDDKDLLLGLTAKEKDEIICLLSDFDPFDDCPY